MTEVIHFCSASGEYGAFSNFSRPPIKRDGAWWPTTEHYFQAQKFFDTRDREAVRRAKSPGLAARIGRDRKRQRRGDWGDGGLGSGRNMLGRILMEVRERLTQDSSLADLPFQS